MPSAVLSSPIGPLIVTADADRLLSISVPGKIAARPPNVSADVAGSPLLKEAMAQLEAWFDHRLTEFGLPLSGLKSARGEALRSAICAIGYGETASYGEVARRAAPGPRAVGQACRRNPFPIIVPCHRVIGAARAISYYSGGDGVATKRWLIDHELNILK